MRAVRRSTLALASPGGVEVGIGGREIAEIEPWHQVGALGEPGFQTPFSPATVAQTGLYLRKTPMGEVELRGGLRIGGATPAEATIFTLSDGYRPGFRAHFWTPRFNPVIVEVDGRVLLLKPSTGIVDPVSLDMVRFVAGN